MAKHKILQTASKSNNSHKYPKFFPQQWLKEITNYYKYSHISPLIYHLYSLGITQETIAGLWGVSKQRVAKDYPLIKEKK